MISSKAEQYAITLIKQGEGFYPDVYQDTRGYLTIGIGHKLLALEIGVLKKVTYQQAELLLKHELDLAKLQAKQYWKENLNNMNAERTAVILDMTYNLGSLGKFLKMTQAIKKCDWKKASQQILDSAYAKQVKNRAKRNAQIMKDGKMHSKTQWQH